MIAIAISGAPGAGKGTQSKLIVDNYGFEYISTGEALRSEIEQCTEIGNSIACKIKQGKLVSDEIVGEIIKKVIEKAKKDNKKAVLFDGYPRTLNQACQLDELLKSENINFKGLIALEVSEEVLTERILKRALVSGRSDDNEDSVKKRLLEYKNKTEPIFNYYKKKNKYFGIDGVGEINAIFKDICKFIDSFK